MTVSLIVTTYNWSAALELVLKSALRQTILPCEIIIADDGSTSETSNIVQSMKKKSLIPIYHFWQEDRGFRAASVRNGAIRKSSGEYLVLIDGDMILHPSFIEDHIACAMKNTFVQGTRVLLGEIKTEEILRTKEYHFSFFTRGLMNRKNTIHSSFLCRLFSSKSTTIKGIKTCNFALYKDDAYKINGFNEKFIGWGREDSEFAVRLINYGIVRQDVKFHAIAYHLYHRENTRESLSTNDKLLKEAVDLKISWCQEGLV